MYKWLDAFEINFVDSAAREAFKSAESRGVGEKRIYIGHDKEKFDDFFDFSNIEYIFSKKEDLINYLEDAKDEYINPIQSYREDLKDIYFENVELINSIVNDEIHYRFNRTYDNQNRYYLVLEENRENSKNYNYIRAIALPRITKFCFVKLEDCNGKKYIYMKPVFYTKYTEEKLLLEKNKKEEKENIVEDKLVEENVSNAKSTKRLGQGQYKENLLKVMHACVFTSVAYEELIDACHIKPHSVCDENEKYDVKNGILMTPTYHRLFDRGYISFEDNGRLMVTPFLPLFTRKLLNLIDGKMYRLQNGSEKYLKYHRENIFKSIQNVEIEYVAEEEEEYKY